MSDANSAAFKKVFDYYTKITGKTLTKVKEGKGRYHYLSTNETEKAWLKGTKLNPEVELSPRLVGVPFSFDHKNYIVFWGPKIDFSNGDIDILIPVNLNAGLLTALLAETSLTILDDFEYIEFEEKITSQHLAVEYDGYDFNDWLEFLPHVNVFEIPTTSILFQREAYRIACYILLVDNKQISLPFTSDTISVFLKLVLEEEGQLSFENIFNCLSSVNWRHSYLELYRCIERLYPIKALKQLHGDLSLTVNLLELAEKIEASTGWRPKEEVAIKSLLDDSPEKILTLYKEYLGKTPENADTHAGQYIYILRNHIVHFRTDKTRFNLTPQLWDELIKLKAEIIMHFYKEYKADII